MTSALESDVQDWYENRVRERLPSYLVRALNLVVYEPVSGFNQKYQQTTFAFGPWPLQAPAQDAELDFVGHARDIKVFPESGTTIGVNNEVSVQLSPCRIPDTSPPLQDNVKYTTPTKGFNALPVESSKYVIAEITLGGRKAVKSKVSQLERASVVLLSKASHLHQSAVPLLDVILLAFVVSAKAVWSDVLAAVNERNGRVYSYPNMQRLFQAGRFGLVCDYNSLSTVVRTTEAHLHHLSALIEINTADLLVLSSDVMNLTELTKANSEKLDSLIAGKKEKDTASRIKILSDQIKDSERFGYSADEIDSMKAELRGLVQGGQSV